MKQTKAPKMVALQTLDVPVAPAAPEADASKAKFVYCTVPGNSVTEFVVQSKAEKEAKKLKDDSKKLFSSDAVEALFTHNIANVENPLTTVKVTDEKGGCCNVSFKDQYSDLDYSKTLAILQKLGVRDPNKFVAEHLVIGFDTSVFYGDGGLRQKLYEEMLEAIAEVANRHGVASPFSSTKVLRVKDNFHKDRWTIGNNTDDQDALTKAVPNTTSFTPVVA